jgi:hypothetical protein
MSGVPVLNIGPNGEVLSIGGDDTLAIGGATSPPTPTTVVVTTSAPVIADGSIAKVRGLRSGGGMVGTVLKGTNDVRAVTVDMSAWLAPGELIGSVITLPILLATVIETSSWQLYPPPDSATPSVSLAPLPPDTTTLVLDDAAVLSNGVQVQLMLAVGTPGLAYIVSFLVVSDLSERQKEIDILVIVSASLNAVAPPGAPPVTLIVSGTTTIPTGYVGDAYVENATSAPFTVTLPQDPFLGQAIEATDVIGNCGTYTVTWVGYGGVTINGESDFLFNTDNQSAKFKWTGTQWMVT